MPPTGTGMGDRDALERATAVGGCARDPPTGTGVGDRDALERAPAVGGSVLDPPDGDRRGRSRRARTRDGGRRFRPRCPQRGPAWAIETRSNARRRWAVVHEIPQRGPAWAIETRSNARRRSAVPS